MEKLSKFLKKFKFVKWDRYVATELNSYYIYGWIEREDSYKDFIVIEWDEDSTMGGWFITSSAKWDEEIKKIMGTNGGKACQRVEHLVDISNSIKL